jgi:hypothetical protein
MERQRKQAINSLFTGSAGQPFCPVTLYQKDFIASTALSNDVLAQKTSEVLDYLPLIT